MVFRDSLFEAYVDIETTGLSVHDGEITVIGLYLAGGNQGSIIQLMGNEISKNNLIEALSGAEIIFTYNGSRFDLPFIHAALDINLEDVFKHHDLMYDCWSFNLFGGFKAIKEQLGISRNLQNATGWNLIRLWKQYQQEGDEEAKTLLLGYNKEDLMNLKIIREKLLWMNSIPF